MLVPLLAAALASTAPAPSAAPAPEPTVTLLAAGDVTLGQHFEEFLDGEVAKGSMTALEARQYAFARIRKVTRAADLFVVNLECPFTWRGQKIPKNFNFRARPELSAVLTDGGVDAVSLANNHLYDYGPDGLVDTMTTLMARGIPFFGAGMNLAEARRPAILKRNGLTIAFLGYFYLDDHNIEPKEVYATATKPGVAGCHSSHDCDIGAWVAEDVRRAAAQADIVIPFFHWGKEAQHQVFGYQRRLAHIAIDAGAKLVLGSHPHVIHGIEWYKGVPIVYSLGNFIFGGNWGPKDEYAIAVRAVLQRAGVKSLTVLPMQFTNPPAHRFQPRFLTGDEAKPVLARVKALSDALVNAPLVAPLR